jgi:hypothetical protein
MRPAVVGFGLLLAVSLPAPRAGAAVPLEEIGASEPGRRCFTGHPQLFDADGMFRVDRAPRDHGGYEVTDVGDVTFIAGPWSYSNLNGNDIFGSLGAFLAHHENDYDFVSLFVSQHLEFGAFYSGIQNDVTGIGQGRYDRTDDYGIEDFDDLEGFLFMNSIFDYQGGIHDWLYFGQEVGHRWGSFLDSNYNGSGFGGLLGRDASHWSFFMHSDNSAMEGNSWVPVSNDRFETDHMDDVGYSDLDMYLMGFAEPEDVEDWFLIRDPVVVSDPFGWLGNFGDPASAAPYYTLRDYLPEREARGAPPIVVGGDRVDLSIDHVIDREGERDPPADESQRDFTMALVIMHPSSEELSFEDYLEIEDIREWLEELWGEMVRGEAQMDIRLGTSGDYTLKVSDFPRQMAWMPQNRGASCHNAGGGQRGVAALLWCLGLGGLLVRRR